MEFAPANPMPKYRGLRAYSRARVGRLAEAIAEMSELTQLDAKDPIHWFLFARIYALASVDDATKKGEYESLALAQLREAVMLGFNDPTRIAVNADLASLRGNDEFNTILAELRKK